MRKLLLSAIPAILIALPSAAVADQASGDQLIATPLASDPFERPAASRAARAAARLARRDAKPEPEKVKPVSVSPALQAIANCESGGNPAAIGGGGLYRGKYQFSVDTWQAVGGTGDPAAAPEAEQDRRATILYAQAGPGQWPVCSQ